MGLAVLVVEEDVVVLAVVVVAVDASLNAVSFKAMSRRAVAELSSSRNSTSLSLRNACSSSKTRRRRDWFERSKRTSSKMRNEVALHASLPVADVDPDDVNKTAPALLLTTRQEAAVLPLAKLTTITSAAMLTSKASRHNTRRSKMSFRDDQHVSRITTSVGDGGGLRAVYIGLGLRSVQGITYMFVGEAAMVSEFDSPANPDS